MSDTNICRVNKLIHPNVVEAVIDLLSKFEQVTSL